jgi:Ca2+-binding EF-hand superfamily protein
MIDGKDTGYVTLNEMKKVFKDYRIKAREDDSEQLFDMFSSGAGKVNYKELLKRLIVA